MKLYPVTSILILFIAFTFNTGCQSGGEEASGDFIVEGEGIAVEGSWARPAGEGRMSGGYFIITNFEDVPDTLTGISSDIARYTEIHESYESENGMMGMREIPELVIPAQSTVTFEPGGLHIMFIQLNESISEGQEIELTLHFSNKGDLLLLMPVRS